jgi:hypothetical protein
MGLWGVFIGPIVACCLHSLIEIFNSELKATTELPGVSESSIAMTAESAAENGLSIQAPATTHPDGDEASNPEPSQPDDESGKAAPAEHDDRPSTAE